MFLQTLVQAELRSRTVLCSKRLGSSPQTDSRSPRTSVRPPGRRPGGPRARPPAGRSGPDCRDRQNQNHQVSYNRTRTPPHRDSLPPAKQVRLHHLHEVPGRPVPVTRHVHHGEGPAHSEEIHLLGVTLKGGWRGVVILGGQPSDLQDQTCTTVCT